MRRHFVTFGILAAAMTASADSRVVSKYTTDGKTSETAVLTKGSAQRYDYGKDAAVIQQCDRKQIIQLNIKNQTVTRIPMGGSGTEAAPAAPPPGEAKKGGVVTVKFVVTDTKERKKMFGMTARHLKSVMTREPGPGACDTTKQRVEIDGWYVDAPQTASCQLETPTAAGAPGATCNDEIKYENSGNGEVGFPVSYTMTTYGADNKPVIMTMVVTEFDTKELDASLFEAPAGFKEISLNAVAAQASGPKTSGTTRIGVAPLHNKTQYGGNLSALDARVVGSLRQNHTDAVLLNDGPEGALQKSAKQLDCDYILYVDLAEVGGHGDQPEPGKKKSRFGSLVKGVGQLAGASESSTARIDYRLEPAAGGQPILTATANGKTGGFGLRNALTLGMTVGTMALQAQMFGPMAMMNPKMMNSMMGMTSMAGGGARMGLDPSMMMMTRIMHTTSGAGAGSTGEPKGAQDNAIAAAIQELAKGVANQAPKSPEARRAGL